MFHNNPLFRCYFGDAKDALFPESYLALSNEPDILSLVPFAQLQKGMHLHKLVFLRQTHSTDGLIIADGKTADTTFSFARPGDYLITNQKNVGLGVMTADCLPIVIVDTVRSAVGIAHAGWRGTVAGISTTMLRAMHDSFGTQPDQVKVFFGPCAKVCCYAVKQSFLAELEHIPFSDQLILTHNNQHFFDVALCNRLLLEDAGVKKEAFGVEYNVCTICNSAFYSHRRGNAGRQMTVISLV